MVWIARLSRRIALLLTLFLGQQELYQRRHFIVAQAGGQDNGFHSPVPERRLSCLSSYPASSCRHIDDSGYVADEQLQRDLGDPNNDLHKSTDSMTLSAPPWKHRSFKNMKIRYYSGRV